MGTGVLETVGAVRCEALSSSLFYKKQRAEKETEHPFAYIERGQRGRWGDGQPLRAYQVSFRYNRRMVQYRQHRISKVLSLRSSTFYFSAVPHVVFLISNPTHEVLLHVEILYSRDSIYL